MTTETTTTTPWAIVAKTSEMIRVAPIDQTIDERGVAVICDVYGFDRESAALLIKAAPKLLRALKQCRGQWVHSVNAPACLAAITEAEGDSP